MKDFIKWLGVNEKIAKVVVWLLIIMVCLIIFNTAMESIGFPYYAITYKNINKIDQNTIVEYIVNWIMRILDFYVIVLLVFRVKEYKKIFKYAILYLILNIALTSIIPYHIMQVFIVSFLMIFCYLYSNKNYKYSLYAIIATIFAAIVQGVWYLSKARFIDYTAINDITKSILSLDYYIIMFIIILVKEVYLKKRGEK